MEGKKYRYYAYDLYTDACFGFETRGELLRWRYARCGDHDVN